MPEVEADELAAWFKDRFGHALGEGPREHIHPMRWEAEQRQAERAERNAEFERMYGSGR